MFVDIKKFKGALEIENMLTPFKRGKAEITPEACYRVLEATNYKRNIRDMLECILKLPAEKQAEFREAVLGAFDNREQPNEILVLGKKLAVLGGYEAELGEAAKVQEGEFLRSGVGVDKWVAISACNWENEELPTYKKIALLGENAVLPYAKNLPANLDASRCSTVDLSYCDLAGINLKFREGAEVNLSGAENLPKGLDASRCSKITLQYCDLAGMSLKFREGAEVNLSGAENLPKDLDASRCSTMDLGGCDLAEIEKIKFKNSEQMVKSGVTIPENWGGKLEFADGGLAANAAEIWMAKGKGGR